MEDLHGWGRCGFFSGIYQLSVDKLTETKGAESLGSHIVMVTIAGVILLEEGALELYSHMRLGAMMMASLHDISREPAERHYHTEMDLAFFLVPRDASMSVYVQVFWGNSTYCI